MSVRFFYVDESHDDKKVKFCLSAFGIRHTDWATALKVVQDFRRQLLDQFGVKLRYRLHATDLVAGRGRPAGRRPNPNRYQRSLIFKNSLKTLASLPAVTLINVVLEYARYSDVELTAWQRLFQRIDTSNQKSEEAYKAGLLVKWRKAEAPPASTDIFKEILDGRAGRAVIVADRGREWDIQRALRRMRVFNFVPSNRGQWEDGTSAKNMTVKTILEDPVFRESEQSYFLQLADAAAFALLKSEVPPSENIARYGIHEMFKECLGKVCNVHAHRPDPLGIVRK